MTGRRLSNTHISLAGFLVVLALTWFVYEPATRGKFTLDDQSHLAGLAFVDGPQSAIDYVLEGSNGPTGRPLAMLSFAAQAAQYEHGASAFIVFNILLHLANGVLLAWLCFELALCTGRQRDRALLVALATAGVWLLLPINATATMLVVQRMTGLSAAFVLAGIGTYLAIRRRAASAQDFPVFAAASVIGFATLLATLAKETGALLPVLILVLESTVLRPPSNVARERWRLFRIVVLALPGLLVLAYLASAASYPDWMQARRGFDGVERLVTQFELLWLYLSKALAGLPSRLGIYQPDVAVARSLFEPVAFIATLAWTGLAAAALWLRRRNPLFALAVLWFLAGHALESSVLPLELYFEHRNYVPLVGPLFALCACLFASPKRNRFGLAALALFAALNAGFLYVFASMWGEPSMSSRYWAQRYPDSVRAVTNLASHQLVEEGPQATIDTIRRFVAAHPGHGYLRIQELNLLCLYGASGDLAPLIGEVRRDAPTYEFTYAAANMLSELFTTSTRTDCDVTPDTVRQLAHALRDNPRYAPDPYFNQFHHKLLAAIERHEGDMQAAFDELDTAMSFWPTPELNSMMVIGLVASGDYDAAEEFIDSAMLSAPGNPLKALAWRRGLQRLRLYVREVAANQSAEQAEVQQ